MIPSDVAKLDQLRAHGEAKRFNADRILEIANQVASSIAGQDRALRAFLSDGVVVIFSIEDFSKVEPTPRPEAFRGRGWVRHASVSQQRFTKYSAAEILVRGRPAVTSVVPPETLVREIATHLGFSPTADVFPSPDIAGPFIQHVLEDLEGKGRSS